MAGELLQRIETGLSQVLTATGQNSGRIYELFQERLVLDWLLLIRWKKAQRRTRHQIFVEELHFICVFISTVTAWPNKGDAPGGGPTIHAYVDPVTVETLGGGIQSGLG